MREIKFRLWDEYRKFMDYEPYGLGGQGDYTVCINSFMKKHSKLLMQYTGLVDKNGREIYEGDIIQYFEPNYDESFSLIDYDTNCFVVKWKDNVCGFDLFLKEYLNPTIIGNIYENPELLEK